MMIVSLKENAPVKQTTIRKVLRNFSSLTMGKTLGDAFTFLLFIVLSRTFGQDGIGQYSFAMALTCFFSVFAEFGLYNLSVKEISRHTGSPGPGEYYGGIFSLRLILSVVVLGLLLLMITFLSFSRETKLIILLIGVYQIVYTLVDGFVAVLVAREDMHLAGLLEFLLKMFIALGGSAVIMAGGGLVTALATFPSVTFVFLLVVYGIVYKKYGRVRLVMSWSYLIHTLRKAVPYAITEIMLRISTRIDVVFLGFILGAAAAGVYNAAYRLVFFLIMISYFIGLALFPLASRLYANSRKELEMLYHKSLCLIVLVGLPAASGVWLVAPDIINLIFGEDFAESALVLRYLAWLVFLAFIKSIMEVFLTSCDRQTERARSQWRATMVNVFGNVLLIPTIGIMGAAIATLISETLLVILFTVQLKNIFGWPRIGSRLMMGCFATAVFCLFFVFFSSLSLGVVIPVSVFIYTGTLYMFKEVRINEFSMLMSLLKGESGKPSSISHEVS